MELKEIKQALYTAEDGLAAKAEEVCDWVFRHPELGEEEYESAAYLVEEIKKLGFSVQMPYGGMPTAFRAEYGDDEGPRVGFLAEYDALPGYGELSPNGTGNGHACGHNWIAASTFAAAAALKEVKQHFKGKVVWIGTPAEETCGGKIDLCRAHCFDDLDAVFQFHLSGKEGNSLKTAALACTDIVYTFHGKASHASNSPETGINALDACNLMFAGVNALRQHVKCDTRIHGIIKEGGLACNVVPAKGVVQYFVRAGKKDYLEEVIERVNNCARGAALMTGCELEIARCRNTFYDLKYQPALRESMRKHLEDFGITEFLEGDPYHCGSTDIGNVSYDAPTQYCTLTTISQGEGEPHDAAYLDRVNDAFAYKLLHIAAKSMAASALDVLCDADLRAQLIR